MKMYLKYTTICLRTAADSAAGADSEGPREVMSSKRMAASVQDTTTPPASWFDDFCTLAYQSRINYKQSKKNLYSLRTKPRDRTFFAKTFDDNVFRSLER